jgi:hypothetical protein
MFAAKESIYPIRRRFCRGVTDGLFGVRHDHYETKAFQLDQPS